MEDERVDFGVGDYALKKKKENITSKIEDLLFYRTVGLIKNYTTHIQSHLVDVYPAT